MKLSEMANLMPWSSGQGSFKGDLDSVLCQPQVSFYQSSLQSQLLFNQLASTPLLCKTGVSAFFHFWACWAQNYDNNVLHSGQLAQGYEGEKYINKDRKVALCLWKMPWNQCISDFCFLLQNLSLLLCPCREQALPAVVRIKQKPKSHIPIPS